MGLPGELCIPTEVAELVALLNDLATERYPEKLGPGESWDFGAADVAKFLDWLGVSSPATLAGWREAASSWLAEAADLES